MAASEQYTLYTWGTPNGIKASITLEELGLKYKTVAIDISTNAQKEEKFLKVNPNGRIPAIVDHSAGDLNVFETGAIMWYLASKHPESGLWPKDVKEQAEVMSWLMWQMGGLGPMQGQANHFVLFAPVELAYPIKRYTDETYRLLETLERGLQGKQYLVGDRLTIADLASFSWAIFAPMISITFEKLPNVKAWLERIAERPAVKRGLDVPSKGNAGKLAANIANPTADPELKERYEKSLKKVENARASQ
ncbi:hypothetical protein WJX73_000719 [Symbiochloris irregularis]|uniref:Glutathione S-transferase n=1 Tax=Symbiochloris irregularis TaxID=706552 RepID=A0AAW1P1P0_9CHLO